MINAEQRILNALLRTDYMAFMHRCMLTLNPGHPFLRNWHLDAIAWSLQLVMAGKIKRLIINLPPRSLKSLWSSVAFPAFWLGHDPRHKIFGISYGADLAAKHARDFRLIVEAPWYHHAFPNMRVARVLDSDVYTTERGFRKATSINATLTGLGGDCFIIDDPLKPLDALSDALRNALNDWFSSTLLSRLDDKANGVIIVVMQRVHLHDLTGYLLERSAQEWSVLNSARNCGGARRNPNRARLVPSPSTRRSSAPRARTLARFGKSAPGPWLRHFRGAVSAITGAAGRRHDQT